MPMGDDTFGVSASVMIAPPSPDRENLFSLCFPNRTIDFGVVIELADMIDGVAPHDEYRDEMDMLVLVSFLMQFSVNLSHHWSFLEYLSSRSLKRIRLFLLLSFLLLLFLLLICMRALLAQLRERLTMWTHFFHLTFYKDLSHFFTMFLMIRLWI